MSLMVVKSKLRLIRQPSCFFLSSFGVVNAQCRASIPASMTAQTI